MWAALSDEELIADSDLIVIGVWQEVRLPGGAAEENLQGRIAVSEVLKGRKNLTSIRLAQTSHKLLHSSTDLVFRTGDQGLWLLRQSPGQQDIYLIDHPQRFVPVPGGEQRIRALRRLIQH